MVLAASKKDELIITVEELQLAELMLKDVEASLDKVFAQIGRTIQSVQAEKFIELVKRRGKIPYEEAYRLIHAHFPDFRDYEGILTGAIRSGQLALDQDKLTGVFYLTASGGGRPLPTDNGLPNLSTETKAPNA
jgi:predicted HTH transcriptional regulator